MTTAEVLTVRKRITVPVSPERAFELFTARMSDWWPIATHSLHGDEVEATVFEPWPGGRLYERTGDGREGEWAGVRVYEPPARFLLDWHVNPNRPATEVEVTFTPVAEGTLVELEHRGWESDDDRASYDTGWDQVLERYAAAAR